METVTLRGEDFKTIHNTLCDLRGLVQRMERSMIKVEEFDRIIEGFQMGLKDAYEQDGSAFDRKHDYYNQFREDNGLSTIWSIFNIDEGEFFNLHPWQGAKEIRYHETSAPIKGPTWGDLYRAADEVMKRSGTHHHFIEGFQPHTEGNNSVLWLSTGS
jgi:hypothetical protein